MIKLNYIKFDVSERLWNSCADYVRLYPLGLRSHHNGRFEQQVNGLVTQVLIHRDLIGKFPNLHLKKHGDDGGIDIDYIGKIIDVKSTGRNCFAQPHFEQNVLQCQAGYYNDTYVFCNYNIKRQIVEAVGWLPKPKVINEEHFCPSGTVRTRDNGSSFIMTEPCYEIQYHELYDYNSLKNAQSFVQSKLIL
jgi:hypothetical protein